MKNASRRLLPLCAAVLFATGCAQYRAGPYAADYPAVDRMKAAGAEPLVVGTVQPTDPASPVNLLSLRGARFVSPSGTFAKYLEDALVADLKDALLYDEKARTLLNVRILKNDVDISGVATASAVIDIQLTVAREGRQRLDKTYSSAVRFDSHLMGGIAIPAGQAAYPGLVRELLRSVYSDPQFITAIGK